MYRLFLNTLDSGVKVKWSILDHSGEEVNRSSSKDFKQSVTDFGMITPSHNPSEAIQHPYKLVLEFEHE